MKRSIYTLSYALACGSVYSEEKGEKSVRLWREHGTHHVRYVDFSSSPVTRIWEVFPKQGEAIKFFRALRREYMYKKSYDIRFY